MFWSGVDVSSPGGEIICREILDEGPWPYADKLWRLIKAAGGHIELPG